MGDKFTLEEKEDFQIAPFLSVLALAEGQFNGLEIAVPFYIPSTLTTDERGLDVITHRIFNFVHTTAHSTRRSTMYTGLFDLPYRMPSSSCALFGTGRCPCGCRASALTEFLRGALTDLCTPSFNGFSVLSAYL